MDDTQIFPELVALDYHQSVVAQLRETEAEVWAWASTRQAAADQAREIREGLLRETYRLDPETHPDLHRLCRTAMARLAVDAPVTLYQAGGETMNAALHYIPGEVHLVLYGPILERLSAEEQLALIGHELAHYRLWSIDDGAYQSAVRVFDLALAHSNAAASHFETARLYQLHTELYADRGGALAVGAPGPMITALVKTMTGATSVDADAYLRQAAELDERAGASAGASHPEIFNRAQALDRWWRSDQGASEWIEARICGPLSLQGLDLPRQHRLTRITRGLFARLLADTALQSEAIIAQVQRFFPDWKPTEAAVELAELAPSSIDASVRTYLVALIFDLAMADPELTDAVLAAGARLAADFQALDEYREGLKRDLKLNRKAIDRLTSRLEKAA